jgi:hypothetical protein
VAVRGQAERPRRSLFGGAINLNVHFHTLLPDGVLDVSGDEVRFVAIRPPSSEAVARVLATVIRKVARLGLGSGDVTDETDAFEGLQAAEVDRRLRFPDPFRRHRRSAHLDGFSLLAGVRIDANDRLGLERLCRYAMHPQEG